MLTVALKADKKKLIAGLFIVIIALAVVIMMTVSSKTGYTVHTQSGKSYNTKAEDTKQIDGFLSQFLLKSDGLVSKQQITIPIEFNKAYESYNQLQIKQGLDLSRYKGFNCVLCVYDLKDSDDYISLLIYEDRVVGGHIGSFVYKTELKTFFGD